MWFPNKDTIDKQATEAIPTYLFRIIKNSRGAAKENTIISNTNQNGVLHP